MADAPDECGHADHAIGEDGYYGRGPSRPWTFCRQMTEQHNEALRNLWDCDLCGYPLDNSGGCGCGRGANGGW